MFSSFAPLTKQWLLLLPLPSSPDLSSSISLLFLSRRPPTLIAAAAPLVFMVGEENPLGRNSFCCCLLRLGKGEGEKEKGKRKRSRTEKTNGTRCRPTDRPTVLARASSAFCVRRKGGGMVEVGRRKEGADERSLSSLQGGYGRKRGIDVKKEMKVPILNASPLSSRHPHSPLFHFPPLP